ncbi:MAG: substrate-binding domain-containing protein [Lachnospiraceae bacterium]|nr:substrate-binding domain-containing protein [Lachnospiraceae bacterium]
MKKMIAILGTIFLFVTVNVFLYLTITCRLANNFSGTNQLKMIDVAKFLPFEEASELARTGSSLKFQSGEDLPVLDGAAALVPVYASVIENCYPAGTVTYEGGVFSDDNYYGENFAPDSVMQYQNTVRGFNALVDGSVDLFFTAHPSKEQMQSAKEKGVELEIVPIGMEAFVFFVNKDNPVDGLTTEQIRSIYRGEITNWKEVGGVSKMINPLTRVKGSGSQTMMDKFMEDDMLTSRRLLSVFGAGIGYSFRYYLSGMVADDNVKMLAVDGIYPSAENVRNGSYPISTKFYVVYRKDNQKGNVTRLVEWLLSEEGQTMIEACGYVGLSD